VPLDRHPHLWYNEGLMGKGNITKDLSPKNPQNSREIHGNIAENSREIYTEREK